MIAGPRVALQTYLAFRRRRGCPHGCRHPPSGSKPSPNKPDAKDSNRWPQDDIQRSEHGLRVAAEPVGRRIPRRCGALGRPVPASSTNARIPKRTWPSVPAITRPAEPRASEVARRTLQGLQQDRRARKAASSAWIEEIDKFWMGQPDARLQILSACNVAGERREERRWSISITASLYWFIPDDRK